MFVEGAILNSMKIERLVKKQEGGAGRGTGEGHGGTSDSKVFIVR